MNDHAIQHRTASILVLDMVGYSAMMEGAIEVKNKAPLKMYFLNRLKPEFSKDPAGLTMNDRLHQLLHPATP